MLGAKEEPSHCVTDRLCLSNYLPPQSLLSLIYFVNMMQASSIREEEPQVRKCFHQIGPQRLSSMAHGRGILQSHTHIPLVLCLVLSSLNMQAGDSLQNAPCSLPLCFSRNWTLVWEIGPSHSTSSPKINGRKLPCIFQHGIVNLHL